MDTNQPGCIIYHDVFGAWRWEFTDAKGGVTDSNTSYVTREDCVAAAAAAGVSAEPIADRQARGLRRL